MSVSSVGDVTSLTDGVSTQSAGGNTQVVSLSGGVSTMSSSGATTCYKKKTCSEGGYYSSVPADQKCSSKSYNGYTCYYSCSYKTCSDYGYKSSIPSGQTCTATYPRSGLTCYKDCKNNTYDPVTVTIKVSSTNTAATWSFSGEGKHLSGAIGKKGFDSDTRTESLSPGEYHLTVRSVGTYIGTSSYYQACGEKPIREKTVTISGNNSSETISEIAAPCMIESGI